MYKIDMKKVLILLVTFIIYVNYQNYIKEDMKKLHREITSLTANISREVELGEQNHTSVSLLLDYDKITFSAKEYSYSKAMGEMQNHISDAAKDLCEVKSIKWAQVPTTKEWYDKLRMNIRLTCKPNELFEVTNRLKDRHIIYNIENFKAFKDTRKEYLNISLQLVGFRTNNEVK